MDDAASLTIREAWKDQAVCGQLARRQPWLQELTTWIFFGDYGEREPARDLRENIARRFCEQCPVADDCLAAAVRRSEKYGIWGGIRFPDEWRRRRRDELARPAGVGEGRADDEPAA